MRTHEADLVNFGNHVRAFDRVAWTHEHFAEHCRGLPAPKLPVSFAVNGQEVIVKAFGKTVTAKARGVLGAQGYAVEYVFLSDLAEGDQIEVSRFYLQVRLDDEDKGGVFADADLQSRIMDDTNPRAVDEIAYQVAKGIFQTMLKPRPPQVRSVTG